MKMEKIAIGAEWRFTILKWGSFSPKLTLESIIEDIFLEIRNFY